MRKKYSHKDADYVHLSDKLSGKKDLKTTNYKKSQTTRILQALKILKAARKFFKDKMVRNLQAKHWSN